MAFLRQIKSSVWWIVAASLACEPYSTRVMLTHLTWQTIKLSSNAGQRPGSFSRNCPRGVIIGHEECKAQSQSEPPFLSGSPDILSYTPTLHSGINTQTLSTTGLTSGRPIFQKLVVRPSMTNDWKPAGQCGF
ncbi:hypothetical protein F4824DRAFT_36448 [Ustulina deusta]|nr:hypothetical protein F4824DRAFT_36448 [Ustulina deusta]